MANTVDRTLAKRIIKEHRVLLTELAAVEPLRDRLRQEILFASSGMVDKATDLALREIPVEEINRDKRITRLLEQKQELFDVFADPSEAARENEQSEEALFGTILREELDRVRAKMPTEEENATSPEKTDE